ncbi:hypothetical protein J21TS7_02850 [Paenibacillus cineris]|uniref:Uncharacterized protein n=1 Tax=Paenibacillus cineris TaxID=237530 RepID=A0ABQ4L5T6_9BACL|nr:hypothetical protein J21TS7_02850 [Paenibacillus cineris]
MLIKQIENACAQMPKKVKYNYNRFLGGQGLHSCSINNINITTRESKNPPEG